MAIVGYEITAGAYFLRGRRHLKRFHEPGMLDELFYSALEFRNSIERLLFEQLYLLKVNDWQEKWEREYRPRQLKRTIISVEPEFERKSEFMILFLKILGLPHPDSPLDLDDLNSVYGRLGAFLHAPKRPESTSESREWWDGFVALIHEADAKLEAIMSRPFGAFEMSDKGLALFEKWNSGEWDEAQVAKQITEDFRDHSG